MKKEFVENVKSLSIEFEQNVKNTMLFSPSLAALVDVIAPLTKKYDASVVECFAKLFEHDKEFDFHPDKQNHIASMFRWFVEAQKRDDWQREVDWKRNASFNIDCFYYPADITKHCMRVVEYLNCYLIVEECVNKNA